MDFEGGWRDLTTHPHGFQKRIVVAWWSSARLRPIHARFCHSPRFLKRDGSRYAYRLTPEGVQVALLFLFFHKRLCGPLANSRFHHRPSARHQPASKLEAAYHRADTAIQHIVDLLAA
jgi:hypothetical protein